MGAYDLDKFGLEILSVDEVDIFLFDLVREAKLQAVCV